MALKIFSLVILLTTPFALYANDLSQEAQIAGDAPQSEQVIVEQDTLVYPSSIENASVDEETKPHTTDNTEYVTASNMVKIGNMSPVAISDYVEVITSDNWCDVRARAEFSIKEVNWVGFVLKKGTLSGNIERYVATLYPESNGLINKVGRHLVPGDTCLTGPSADVIMQRIIEPYFAGDVPIVFSSFKNDFYALFYKDDQEFMRYRVGVRK
jgi:hypothetical protein